MKWGMRMQKDLTLEEVFEELGLTELHRGDMSVLVESSEEMNDFMVNYWTEKDKQFESINKYRADKISRSSISYKVFEAMYLENKKVAALEGLFLHKVHHNHVDMLEDRFKSGTLDLRKVYDWHKKNKKSRLLGLVLQTTY
jgi:hypothetical protein